MDAVALVGRIALSAIFVIAGIGKAMAPHATVGYFAHLGLPAPPVAYAVTVVVELVGGLLLLVGFQVRAAAAVLAFWCLATAAVAHNNVADPAQQIQLMKNIAIFGGMLQVVAFGGGRFSIGRR